MSVTRTQLAWLLGGAGAVALAAVAVAVWFCCYRKSKSDRGHVISLPPPATQPDKGHSSTYTQLPNNYQQQQNAYSQQQTTYQQQQTAYPQQQHSYPHYQQPAAYQQQQQSVKQHIPSIQNDPNDVDIEVVNITSAPQPQTARNTSLYPSVGGLSVPMGPPRAPSPFSPMRPPHELYD